MDKRSYLNAHYLATGVEQCLDDYHFLRYSHETISGQETQLNRILRALNQDEIALNWYIDTTPIDRARSRSAYNFERPVYPGSIAYERLRDREREALKKRPSSYVPSQRTSRYQSRLSEQRDRSSPIDSTAEQRALAKKNQKSIQEDIIRQNELNSFTVRYEELPVVNKGSNDQDSLGYMVCEWALPNSASKLKYCSIERQLDNEEWLPIEENIDQANNQVQFNISSLLSNAKDENISSSLSKGKNENNSSLSSDGKNGNGSTLLSNDKNGDSSSSPSNANNGNNSSLSSNDKKGNGSSSSSNGKDGNNSSVPLNDKNGNNLPLLSNDKNENGSSLPSNDKDGNGASLLSNDKNKNNLPSLKKGKSGNDSSLPLNDKNGNDASSPSDNKNATTSSLPSNDKNGNSSSVPSNDKNDNSSSVPSDDKKGNDTSLLSNDKNENSLSLLSNGENGKNSSSLSKSESEDNSSLPSSDKNATNSFLPSDNKNENGTSLLSNDKNGNDPSVSSNDTNGNGSSLLSNDKNENNSSVPSNPLKTGGTCVALHTWRGIPPKNKISPERANGKTENDSSLPLNDKNGNDASSPLNNENANTSSLPSNDKNEDGLSLLSNDKTENNSSLLSNGKNEDSSSLLSNAESGNTSSLPSNTEDENDSSLLLDDENGNGSTRFRLKACFDDGKIFTSKPTDEIDVELLANTRVITPNIEILSANSVQLTWKNDENKKANMYDIEKKEGQQIEWEKVLRVPFSRGVAQINNLIDAQQCQFRLVPSKSDDEDESDVLTVHNVNELLRSLHLEPTSSDTVNINISEEGFIEFDQYKVEYTTIDQLDQWKQVSNITRETPHLIVDKLKPGLDYKFRLTPFLRGTAAIDEAVSSQLSLVLDVKMPSTRKGRLVKNEVKTTAPPSQFAVHQTDPKTVFIEAILPTNKPALFEDVFDVYSKKETADSEWIKIGTIDKDHLSMTMKNLEENTAYTFKIHNQTSPLSDEQNNIVQEFNFETQSVKLYDPSIFLEKIHRNLETVVNNVMEAAAGHQALDGPVNKTLNQVIRDIFLDENLIPNEQYGFDTLALSDDFQLFRGPTQMMAQELEVNEVSELSKNDGEIIIHNYGPSDRQQQPVIVREENGNTRIGHVDGDVIIRNVNTDVLLTNDEKRNQLSMNIVGQAFLKRVQGTLIISKFKGIIVVKHVDKP
ncbi:unnamed protein product [Adineta steineri]|uniref:Fibronectin type-III domain-containing protein n=1 Tax=Adineta steineri TaxID=433720 RepID=A0A818WYM8_9BILA|nr:unnamed protein product [Adineta steineri]